MFKYISLSRAMISRPAVVGVVVLLSAFWLLSSFVVRPRPTLAATNGVLNFQARLMNSSGAIVQDGYYNVEFKLYTANQADGGETPLQGSCTTDPGGAADEDCVWTEAYYDTNGATAGNDFRVRVVNGYLTVNLGSRTAFPSTINWDQDLYITMNIGGTTQTATPTYDGEMTNSGIRMRLTGVPYAFRAGQLAQYNGTSGFTSVLELEGPTVGNQTFQIADQGAAGTYELCVVGSSSCGFASAANAFLQGGNDFDTDAILGTTDSDDLTFVTNNTEKMRLTTDGVLQINSTGTAGTREKLRINDPTTVDNNAVVMISTGATSATGLIIQSVVGQTGNPFEVQDSNGNITWRVARTGSSNLFSNGTGTITLDSGNQRMWVGAGTAAIAGTGGSAATVSVTPSSTRNGIVVQGASGQTADLQVWQSNGGTNKYLRVSATGVLGSPERSTASSNTLDVNITSGDASGTTSNSGNVNIDVGTATATTGTISVGNTNASAVTVGRSGISTTFPGTVVLSALGTANTSAQLCRNSSNEIATCSGSGTGAAFVQGGNDFGADAILGTTDNDALTFITNNTEKMRLTTDGSLQINSTGTAGTVEKLRVNTPTTVDDNAVAIIAAANATDRNLVLQTTAGQTANLLTAQDSNGTGLAVITSSGGFQAKSGSTSSAGLSFVAESSLGFYRPSAGNLGVTVNGESARFDSAGLMIGSTGSRGTVEKFRVNTPASTDNAAATILSTGGTTNKGLVVQGIASQTANLQEWQTSNGTILLRVAPSGTFGTTDTNAASTHSAALNIYSGNAVGSTSNSGNIAMDVGTATGTAGTVSIGTGNASEVGIGRTGVATTVNGSLVVTQNTTLNGSQLTNNGSTLLTSSALSNFGSGGAIGTAAAAVDVFSSFTINQTTAGQTLSLPTPTDATAGRIVYVANIGSTPFTMHGVSVTNAKAQNYIWNGSAWTPTNIDGAGSGVTFMGTIDSQTKSADGAVISGNGLYLQTADASAPGLVSTGTQIFAGAKTFNGNVSLNSGTLLTNQTTFNLLNTTATTVNAFGAATAINLGASGGTTITSGGSMILQSGGTNQSMNIASAGTGTINIDTGGAGAIDIGDTNAASVNIGRNAISTTVSGRLAVVRNDSDTTLWGRTDDLSFTNGNGTNNTWTGIGFNDGDSTAAGIAAQYYDTTNNYGRLVFSTRGSSGFATNNLVLQNGNVGIGVAAPTSAKLQFASDNTPAGGIQFGSDTNLYRSDVNTLQTDGSLLIGNIGLPANLVVFGTLGNISTSTSGNNIDFSRNGANYITATDGSGTLQFGSGGNQGQLVLTTAGNLTLNQSSTVSTSTGSLNLQGFSTTTLTSVAQSAASTNSAAVQIQSGNASGTTSTAGNISIDVGTSTTSNGSILIGTAARTQTITIGNSTGGAIRVGQNGGTLQLDGTNFDLSTAGVLTLAGGQTRDITTLAAGTSTAIVLQPGTSSSGAGPSLTLKGGDSSASSQTAGSVTIQGGNETGGSGTRVGGSVVIDAGTGGAANNNGTITIGATNASNIQIGSNGITTNYSGRFTVARADSGTVVWDRVDDVSFYNTNGTNNTWTGIGFNDGGGLAAGIAAQYYNTANDYARLIFSTRGAAGFSSNTMVLEDGRVGVGTAPSTYRLEVTDSQASNYVARIQNSATNNTADGLLINLGVANASRGSGNYFIGFAGNGTVAGKIQGGASAVAYTTNNADYAEYFKADPSNLPQPGELVMLDQGRSQHVRKSDVIAGTPLAGVVSTNPGFIGNGPICAVDDNDCETNYEKYNVLVALSGQVPVKVNTSNGPIQIGDPVTFSSTVGEGAKATGAGYIVGYALEPLTSGRGSIKVLIRPQYDVSVASNMNEQDIIGDDDSVTGSSLNISGQATVSNLTVSNAIKTGTLKVTGAIQAGNLIVTNLLKTKDLTVTNQLIAKSMKVEGNAEFDGDIVLAGQINTKQNAIVKKFKAADKITAGSVVVLDPVRDGFVMTTTTAQDTKIIGVAVSTADSRGKEVGVAIGGQVQVSAEGAITAGDLLVTSTIAGNIKTDPNPRVGSVLGKATSQKGTDNKVWILLTLQ